MRQVDLIILVIGNSLSVGRAGEPVRKLFRLASQVDLVAAVAIHAKRLRIAVDERCETQLGGIARPIEEATVVEADALDGRNVDGRPAAKFNQVSVEQP